LAETSVVKSRPSVPHGASLFSCCTCIFVVRVYLLLIQCQCFKILGW